MVLAVITAFHRVDRLAQTPATSKTGGGLFQHRDETTAHHNDAASQTTAALDLWSGILLTTVGLARPQSGKSESRITGEGIAIELVLDISGSMEAVDFQLQGSDVSRLEAVKHVIGDFVLGSPENELQGRDEDLIGVVAFGGFADRSVR